ncbi:GGDEF domain-containing protein [Vibrio vulnificus]|uniref:GGDEF domain-containing protein n=1 Tax=Vibrio vulnificus TaxID=672 RepID=UPI001F044FBF|nr:diguanylate cyclase [Vibrio vulnificus]MCG9651650.1 diguanylate cyclase [Vibrio vulnificus]
MVLYQSKLSPSTATIELRSLLIMIVVIFVFNTPQNLIKREKIETVRLQLSASLESLNTRKELIQSYLSLADSQIAQRYFSDSADFIDLVKNLVQHQKIIRRIRIIDKQPAEQEIYSKRVISFNRFYQNDLNRSQRQTILDIENGLFVEFSPIYQHNRLMGYLSVEVDLIHFTPLFRDNMLHVDLDGFVYSSSYADITAFTYLKHREQTLLQELNRTQKTSSVLELQGKTFVYQNVGQLNGKTSYLVKIITNEELIPKYFYLIPLLLAITVGACYYLYKLSKAQKKLKEISYLDPLSGLNNRHFLAEVEKQQLPLEHYYAVMLDIDHFKSVNDRYGHDIGDQVIRRVAKVVKSRVRVSDYAFRIGGEEFLLLVKTPSSNEARQVCERIRQDVENMTQAPHVTVSIGFTALQAQLDETIRIADSHLYDAKRNGRNRVCPNA